MKAVVGPSNLIRIELTRRNLTSLLAKLDGHPKDSPAVLQRGSEDGRRLIVVRAVEDEVHYRDREPGELHPETLEAMGNGSDDE